MADQRRPPGASPGLLIALAMLSGSCALAYETLYVRALTTVLGDMFYVHAALLSTFLVGIGLGAKLAHRFLRWLFACEMGVGVYALLLPGLLHWLGGQPFVADVTASAALTIAATIALVAVPSLLIGFSIPLFSAYIKAHQHERPAFAGVYEAYNLGALLAIFFVEFVAVRHFGISRSLALMGTINLAIGGVLLWTEGLHPGGELARPRRFAWRVTAALALGSAGSAAFQLFSLKLSHLVFYPHRENFALALGVNLLGIYLGTLLVTRFRLRFATLLLGAALLIGATFLAYLPILHLYLDTVPLVRHSEWLFVAHKSLFLCVFALGPMTLFGGLIPSLMLDEREVAGESGHLLFVSSVANAAGYLAYVLVAHPWFEVATVLAAIGGAAIAGAVLASGFRLDRWQRILAGAAVLGLSLNLFLSKDADYYVARWQREVTDDYRILTFKNGAESATLVDYPGGSVITYNGHHSIGVETGGKVTAPELSTGVIGALSAPRLGRALVLGLGTGITASAVSNTFASTDIVEINDAFVQMLPHLAHANLDLAHDPRVHIHVTDARAFMVGGHGEYDAIVSSVSAPTYFSASKLYTAEFYARVKRALKRDGTFTTWLATRNMTEQGLWSVLSALHDNFERCDLRLLRSAYFVVTCSDHPFVPRRFSELPATPRLVATLEKSLAPLDLDEYFEDQRVSENIFAKLEDFPEPNTDDLPILEFLVTRGSQVDEFGSDPFLEEQERLSIDPVREWQNLPADRMARRAAAFYLTHSPLFEDFRPLLARRPAVAEALNDYLETQRGDEVKGSPSR